MDDPGNDVFDERDPLDRLLSHGRAEARRAALARRRGDDALARRRAARRRGHEQRLNSVFYELGLITRDDWDELDLRVAQLEHRLRLVEDRLDRLDPPAPRTASNSRLRCYRECYGGQSGSPVRSRVLSALRRI